MKLIKKINIKNSRLLASALIALMVTVIPAGVAMAWGPGDRATFTIQKPADHVTFNSITDNPNQGDERNFVQIKETSNTAAGGWKDELTVEPGKQYWVRAYVHNNAAANLNLVSTNTRATAAVPAGYTKSATIGVTISSDNAKPQRVWDEAYLKSDKNFKLAYIKGSASWKNNHFKDGVALNDSIITSTGTLLGYDKLDGRIPGCFQYDGVVTFKVVAQTEEVSNLITEKKVRKHGTTEWSKTVSAKPGEKVDYQIMYKNYGSTVQKNVNIYDKLPKGVSYQNNTTTLKNANNPNGDGLKVQSNALTTKGLNIGDYSSGSNAYIRFTAQIAAAKDLKCGTNTLRNFGHATADGKTVQDFADVSVKVECKPKECKPGIPEGSKDCEEKCEVPGKGDLKSDDPNCKEDEKCAVPGKEGLEPNDPECREDGEPALPTELPKTGPMEAALMIIAIIAITGGVAYWYRSREELKKATEGTNHKSVSHKKDDTKVETKDHNLKK